MGQTLRVKEDSSFSEEKEAKRLLSIVLPSRGVGHTGALRRSLTNDNLLFT
jgi:hypothetical protein